MDITDVKKSLLHFKRKIITYDELKELFCCSEHKDVVNVINAAKDMNVLEEVPSSEFTYKLPEVRLKYRILREQEDLNHFIKEINSDLYYRFNSSYYKNNLKEYKETREIIKKLSLYFKTKLEDLEFPMSVNERSFLIFGNEKTLGLKSTLNVLSNLGLTLEDLNVYKTPEPFFYAFNKNSRSSKVLIIENKDTWYTMRGIMRENKPIFNHDFRALIYGEGKKILSSFEDVRFNEDFKDIASELEFLYFGDIDRGGIKILLLLLENFREYSIIPFKDGYSWLMKGKDAARDKDGTGSKSKNIKLNFHDVEKLFDFLDEKTLLDLWGIAEKNFILPQEMLNNKELRMMNNG